MKRFLVIVLALSLMAIASQALAAELTEEHFPGYYVKLNTGVKEFESLAKNAGWHRGSPVGGPYYAGYMYEYPNRSAFTYEGDDNARYSIFYSTVTVTKTAGTLVIEGNSAHTDPASIHEVEAKEPTAVAGSDYTRFYASSNDMMESFNAAKQWMDERFGAALPAKDKHNVSYLLLMDDQLVEVRFSARSRSKDQYYVSFTMLLADSSEDTLTKYGYQSREDVPVASWEPMGIEPKK